jgi:hypothetical protein
MLTPHRTLVRGANACLNPSRSPSSSLATQSLDRPRITSCAFLNIANTSGLGFCMHPRQGNRLRVNEVVFSVAERLSVHIHTCIEGESLSVHICTCHSNADRATWNREWSTVLITWSKLDLEVQREPQDDFNATLVHTCDTGAHMRHWCTHATLVHTCDTGAHMRHWCTHATLVHMREGMKRNDLPLLRPLQWARQALAVRLQQQSRVALGLCQRLLPSPRAT